MVLGEPDAPATSSGTRSPPARARQLP